MLLERNDLVCWRRDYLQKICQYRAENRPIFYTDKTWVNSGISTSKCWKDETITSARNAFILGLSASLKNSNGAGERLIVGHIGK